MSYVSIRNQTRVVGFVKECSSSVCMNHHALTSMSNWALLSLGRII